MFATIIANSMSYRIGFVCAAVLLVTGGYFLVGTSIAHGAASPTDKTNDKCKPEDTTHKYDEKKPKYPAKFKDQKGKEIQNLFGMPCQDTTAKPPVQGECDMAKKCKATKYQDQNGQMKPPELPKIPDGGGGGGGGGQPPQKEDPQNQQPQDTSTSSSSLLPQGTNSDLGTLFDSLGTQGAADQSTQLPYDAASKENTQASDNADAQESKSPAVVATPVPVNDLAGLNALPKETPAGSDPFTGQREAPTSFQNTPRADSTVEKQASASVIDVAKESITDAAKSAVTFVADTIEKGFSASNGESIFGSLGSERSSNQSEAVINSREGTRSSSQYADLYMQVDAERSIISNSGGTATAVPSSGGARKIIDWSAVNVIT